MTASPHFDRQIRRLVEGAITDTINCHPEYLTKAGKKWARESIAKRLSGSLIGYVEQSAQGRSEHGSAAERKSDAVNVEGQAGKPAYLPAGPTSTGLGKIPEAL